jgi:xylulokinase
MEGVALALADGHGALIASGARIDRVTLTGGGARSALWARLLAAAIGLPLSLPADAHAGPAIGAARLARQAIGGPLIAPQRNPGTASVVDVDPLLREQLAQKRWRFRKHLALV